MSKSATWRNTPFAAQFYHSAAWKGARQLAWDRAHGLCERCGAKGEVVPADVVHHKVPLSVDNINDPDVTVNPDNLVALCHECHTEVHQQLGIGAMNGRLVEEPRVGFDSEGNVIRLER